MDIHPSVRISTPRTSAAALTSSADHTVLPISAATDAGGWVDGIDAAESAHDPTASGPSDMLAASTGNHPAPPSNGSFVLGVPMDTLAREEDEQSVLHSPHESRSPLPASPGFAAADPAPIPSTSSPVMRSSREDDRGSDNDARESVKSSNSVTSSSSSSSSTSSSSDDDESSSGDDSGESEQEGDDDDIAGLEAQLPKPRRTTKSHGDDRSDSDDSPQSLHRNYRPEVVPARHAHTRGGVPETQHQQFKPRPPPGVAAGPPALRCDESPATHGADYRRRAATAPATQSGSSAALLEEDCGSHQPHSTSRARGPRRRLAEALEEAKDGDSSSTADDSDDDSTSSVSSSSETTTTSVTSTTQESSSTAAASPKSVDSTVLDDDRLYAKLVGCLRSDLGTDIGPRERRLRTVLGNVWRQGRSGRRADPKAIHDEVTRDLIKTLVRDRHTYRDAARDERQHRQQALAAAEKAQRVVDGLIARGLSKGASGTSALVNNLPGSEPIHERKKKRRASRRQSESGGDEATVSYGDDKKKSSSKSKSSSSSSRRASATTCSAARSLDFGESSHPAATAVMTSTIPASGGASKTRHLRSSRAQLQSTDDAAAVDLGSTPRPSTAGATKKIVPALDINALQQQRDGPCNASCESKTKALLAEIAALKAENAMLKASAGSSDGAAFAEKTIAAKKSKRKSTAVKVANDDDPSATAVVPASP